MATLITRGYASRMPNRRYTLRCAFVAACLGVDRPFAAGGGCARCDAIADGCGETVYLLQLVGSEAVTLARLTAGRRALAEGEIGPSYPLWATAAGRALLGTLPAAQGFALLPAEPFPAFTPKTKTTWSEVCAAMHAGRRNGMHAEDGEMNRF